MILVNFAVYGGGDIFVSGWGDGLVLDGWVDGLLNVNEEHVSIC